LPLARVNRIVWIDIRRLVIQKKRKEGEMQLVSLGLSQAHLELVGLTVMA
jgi:hypothetical protein